MKLTMKKCNYSPTDLSSPRRRGSIHSLAAIIWMDPRLRGEDNVGWLSRLTNWLLPSFCALCHANTKDSSLCNACLDELPWQENACVRCAKELPNQECLSIALCGQCIQTPPPYHSALCLFRYQPPIDHFILSIKFSEKLAHAQLLGRLIAEKVAQYYATQDKPECIIPVPLHTERLRVRGYNQALEIARPIAKKLRIKINTKHCVRVIPTLAQASTTASERQKNIRNAFSISDRLRAKHVAIVDDVFTTGSTVAELARALKKAGVTRIDVWCCARTVLRRH